MLQPLTSLNLMPTRDVLGIVRRLKRGYFGLVDVMFVHGMFFLCAIERLSLSIGSALNHMQEISVCSEQWVTDWDLYIFCVLSARIFCAISKWFR